MQGRAERSGWSLAGPAATAFAGLLGVSLGVLGWLSAQAATFGVAEHAHLTAHGPTTHRHDYAAPLALGAGASAVLAVLLLLLVHLSSRQHSSSRRPADGHPPRGSSDEALVRLVARCSPAVAALLFVAVEAVEFAGSGTPVLAAAAVLVGGTGLQILTARVVSALTGAVVHRIEQVSALPNRQAAGPALVPQPCVTAATREVERTPVRTLGCRAPPRRHPAFAFTP